MRKIEAKECRRVWDSILDTYPQSLSYNHYDAIEGTVYMLRLEKVDYIEWELCQECSIGFASKSRSESWPVKFFKLFDMKEYLFIKLF